MPVAIRGAGDLSIEKAIAERRFAFSKNRAETLVDPPPASLLLDDLPPAIAKLFEAAFRAPDERRNAAPEPARVGQAARSADEARARRARSIRSTCTTRGCAECPWCRIEDAGGPAFFVGAGGTTIISADRLAVLDDQDLRARRSAVSRICRRSGSRCRRMPVLQTLKERPKRASPDWSRRLMVAAWAVCLGGVRSAALLGAIVLAARHGAVARGSRVSALSARRLASAGGKTVDDYARLGWNRMSDALAKRAQTIERIMRNATSSFDRSTEDLKTRDSKLYRTADDNLQERDRRSNRESQKAEYLRSYLDSRLLSQDLRADAVASRRCWNRSASNRPTTLNGFGCMAFPASIRKL